jgi:HSP20 family protein
MTTVVRWDPFRELASMQGQFGRLFNGLLDWPGQTGESRGAQSWVPPLDVWETQDELVYAFDLPGVPEERIAIEVQDDTLTVSAEREAAVEQTGEGFYRFERRHGTFSRAVGLPQGVDDAKIKATYADGVLEVHVPKPEEAKPRRIQVRLDGRPADVEGAAANN